MSVLLVLAVVLVFVLAPCAIGAALARLAAHYPPAPSSRPEGGALPRRRITPLEPLTPNRN